MMTNVGVANYYNHNVFNNYHKCYFYVLRNVFKLAVQTLGWLGGIGHVNLLYRWNSTNHLVGCGNGQN